ncbi:MAG TPA: polyphosphate polymerase domain-containing protein [Bacteroidales bacterium]|nr:polyphosphate polymerase domain-containing protein [Bacteroidales bacterium]
MRNSPVISLLDRFAPCTLEQAKQVSYTHRKDIKFLIRETEFCSVLENVADAYFVVQLREQVIHPYLTWYFDTPANLFYRMHHNKNYPRYKVRKRKYPLSGDIFLEVKEKTNKRDTRKTRMQICDFDPLLTGEQAEFLGKNCFGEVADLHPVLHSAFQRITLVKKDYSERCTIDRKVTFHDGNTDVQLEGLIIVEVKINRGSDHSPMRIALKKAHIRPSRFSKYCIGRLLTPNALKYNAFKPQLTFVDHYINSNAYAE